jgi:hypothetical protein
VIDYKNLLLWYNKPGEPVRSTELGWSGNLASNKPSPSPPHAPAGCYPAIRGDRDSVRVSRFSSQTDREESFIVAQANLIKFAAESYRRAKYNPMQGIFWFMFVDHWPSISYSVLDYHRQPKQGFYALQTAMQPILPSIELTTPLRLVDRRWVYALEDNPTIDLWVVNDTL